MSEQTDLRPSITRIRARSLQRDGMAVDVTVRGHTFRVDEPAAAGGTDTGPTPMEYLVGAIGPCVTVVIELVAAEYGLDVHGVETAAVAEQDRRALQGVPGLRPRFLSVRLEVMLSTDADDAAVAALRAEVERRCPAVNLLHDAGVPVESVWTARSGATA